MKLQLQLLIYFFLINAIATYSQTQPSGTGSSADPYLIATYDNLLWLSQNDTEWNKSYLVTNNIDASASNDGGEGFKPIGEEGNSFRGNFDGASDQGYKISNLYINRPLEDNVGLFGYINKFNTVIKKVHLDNFSITGKDNVGAIVGKVDNAQELKKITLSGVNSKVIGENNTGGLVGQNNKSTLSEILVEDVKIEHNTTATFENIGGVIGYNSNTDNNRSLSKIVLTNVTVTTNYSRAGGVIGKAENNTSLTNVDIDALTVQSATHAGGVIGQNINSSITDVVVTDVNIITSGRYAGGITGKNDTGTIQNVMVVGTIKSKKSIGGIAGDSNSSSSITKANAIITIDLQNNAEIIGGIVGGNYSSSTISEVYSVLNILNVGNLTGSVGGISSFNNVGSNITLAYYDDTDLLSLTLTDNGGINPLTENDFVNESSFVGFDFTDYWEIGTISKYSSAARPYPIHIDRVNQDLPVELISFDVELKDNGVYLYWKTATEINNDYFQIERSFDKRNWELIGELKGQGNSNSLVKYEYFDHELISNSGYIYYRLKQVDFDGQFTYYQTFLVLSDSLQALKIYPTISHDLIFIEDTSNQPVKIFNLMGQNFTNKVMLRQEHRHKVMSLASIPKGWYIIKTLYGSEKVYRK